MSTSRDSKHAEKEPDQTKKRRSVVSMIFGSSPVVHNESEAPHLSTTFQAHEVFLSSNPLVEDGSNPSTALSSARSKPPLHSSHVDLMSPRASEPDLHTRRPSFEYGQRRHRSMDSESIIGSSNPSLSQSPRSQQQSPRAESRIDIRSESPRLQRRVSEITPRQSTDSYATPRSSISGVAGSRDSSKRPKTPLRVSLN